jgi:hypothetical protein
MPYHIFTHEDLHMDLAIMYSKEKADHFRRDDAGARPGLNHTCLDRLFTGYLLKKPFVDIWAFFE